MHNCSVTVKYGPKKKKKRKQYSGENEEQLKNFAHSPILLLKVQSTSAEVEPVREPPEKDEAVKKGPERNE